MSAPATVACTADVWTLVASSVLTAQIYPMGNASGVPPRGYRVNYVRAGATAPLVANLGTMIPPADRDGGIPSYRGEFDEKVDVYVMPRTNDATVLVHSVDAEPVVMVSETAISTAPIGGVNVPSDAGLDVSGFDSGHIQFYLVGGVDFKALDATLTVTVLGNAGLEVAGVPQFVDMGASILDVETGIVGVTLTASGATPDVRLIDLGEIDLDRIRLNYSFDIAPDGTDGQVIAVFMPGKRG